MQQRNLIIFSRLFVALSQCNKQNFGLWHWATATNRIFVCRSESLQQTKSVYVTKKSKKTTTNVLKKCKIRHKSPKKCQKEVNSGKKLSIVDTFGKVLATYTNFVCRSDSVRQTICLIFTKIQCNKLNFCLSQWLSATNNIDTNFLFISGFWQRNWKKSQKQTSFQIWISPALSNCFGVLCGYITGIFVFDFEVSFPAVCPRNPPCSIRQ